MVHCVATLLSAIAAYLSARSLWHISTRVDLSGESLSLRHTIKAWQSRVVYHVLIDRFAQPSPLSSLPQCPLPSHYCGGTFLGLLQHLPYIRGLGFDALLLSPVTENSPYGYHGYWPRSFTEINGRFGSEEDLRAVVHRAHSLGMLVMIDVVVNHIGCPQGGGPCDRWQERREAAPWEGMEAPFNESSAYHHPPCAIDFAQYDAATWQNCWLAGLPDLNHSNPAVRRVLINASRQMIRRFGFDAILIDAAHHMSESFTRELRRACGVPGFAELVVPVLPLHARQALARNYEDWALTQFHFTIHEAMASAFSPSGSLIALESMLSSPLLSSRNVATSPDPTPMFPAIFLDNHDSSRFLSVVGSDLVRLRNALALLVFTRGVPFVYYGTEQAFSGAFDPWNRESLWPFLYPSHPIAIFIRHLISIRTDARPWEHQSQPTLFVSDSVYVFARGPAIIAVSNRGNRTAGGSFSIEISLPTPFKASVVCNRLRDNECIRVGRREKATIVFHDWEPKLYVLL